MSRRASVWRALVLSAAATALAAVPGALATGSDAAWNAMILSTAGTTSSQSQGILTPFDTDTGQVAASGLSLDGATAVAITPDGRTAWVARAARDDGTGGVLIPVDLGRVTPGTPVPLPGATTTPWCATSSTLPGRVFQSTLELELDALAITPNGHTLYAAVSSTDSVYPVDLTGSAPAVGPAIALPAGSRPVALVMSRDGATVYAVDAGGDAVTPISTATNRTGAPISLAAGAAPAAMAITPDGATAYIVEAGRGAVVPVHLATAAVGSEITTGGVPNGIAITPDGTKAYVTTGGGLRCLVTTPSNHSIVPIDIATNRAEPAIQSADNLYAKDPEVMPDGRTLWVDLNDSSISEEDFIDLRTGQYTAWVTHGPSGAPPGDEVDIAFGPSHASSTGSGGTEGSGATIQGTVRTAAGAPTPATVTVCTATYSCDSSSLEQTQATGADGHYVFHDLTPGRYVVTAWGGTFYPASASVTPGPGTTSTVDLVLRPPVPLPPGVSVSSPDGTVTGTVPQVNFNEPFSVNVPIDEPQRPEPGSTELVGGIFDLTDGNGLNLADAALFEVHYGSDGRPARVSELAEGPGTLVSQPADTGPQTCRSASPVGLQPTDSGGVQLTIDSGGLPLQIRFNPIAFPSPEPTGNAALDVAANGLIAVGNAALDAVPGIGEYNATIYGLNVVANAANGNYAQALATGVFSFGVPALAGGLGVPDTPFHGPARFTAWEFTAGVAENQVSSGLSSTGPCTLSGVGGSIYIDPSGVVKSTSGAPLQDAKVTLGRAASAHGRPVTVPQGSQVMSPENRRNPDRTDALGHFGWDVVPGYYRVTASHAGCTAAGTRLTLVPPPVSDIVIRLSCPHLRLSPSKTTLTVGHPPSGRTPGVVALRAHVGGSAKPLGTVTFSEGRKRFAVIPVDAGGNAALTVVRAKPGAFTATYSGDSTLRPSSGRAR